MLNKSFAKTKKHYLFCPGPVNVAQNVKDVAFRTEIGHREKEFSDALSSINRNLLALYSVKSTKKYRAIVITGSGTAANETILSSVVHKKHILILTNGEFGERLYEISKIHNKNTHVLKFEWAEKIDLQKVESYLQKKPVDLIAMVHHETSTGMLNPIEAVGKLAKKYKKQFIVDTVSSVGAETIDVEKCNITFVSGSAAKAIGSIPGASFVIGKVADFESLATIPSRTAYLNLYKFYHYATTFEQTPNTPAVQVFYALNQALENIVKEGVQKRLLKTQKRAEIFRKGLKDMGLSFLIEEAYMSSVLTTAVLPKHITFQQLHDNLMKKNIVVYNGKGPFINKVFQVGNIGEFTEKEMHYFLSALRLVIVPRKPIAKHVSRTMKRNNKLVLSSRSKKTSAPSVLWQTNPSIKG